MSKLAGAVGVACALMSGAASAGAYFGASGVLSERASYENVDRATGFNAFAGYRFDDLPLVVELAYLDAGDSDINDPEISGVTLGYSGFSATIGWYGALSPNGSGFWLRGGYYTGDAEFTTEFGIDGGDFFLPPGTYEDSSNGFTIGLGADWMLTDWFGLRFGLDGFLGMTDFQNDETMTTYSLGIVLHLPSGGSAPAGAPVFRAPEPYMPPQAQPAPMPPAALVAEQPEPAPAATPVPMAAVSGLSLLVVDAAVRSQPRMQAQTETMLPANQTVTARNRVSNAEGRWWFVQHENIRGWVPESAFDPTTLPR